MAGVRCRLGWPYRVPNGVVMGFTEQEEAGMQPDPEFKAFFAGAWRELHGAVEIPGMRYASWDRKAAYLLWCMGSHYARDTGLDDWQAVLMGYIVPDAQTIDDNARLSAGFAPKAVGATDPALRMPLVPGPCPICHSVGGHASSCPNGPKAVASAASVGKTCNCANYLDCDGSCLHVVNPDELEACLPFPEGIPLAFDSAKW
jgi:hypothetical protein